MLPALIVGALTAWYLGLRPGVIAAAVTAGALFIAMFVPVPGISIAIYTLVVAWCAALYFLGGKITERVQQPSALFGLPGRATAWARKLFTSRSEK